MTPEDCAGQNRALAARSSTLSKPVIEVEDFEQLAALKGFDLTR